MQSDKKVRESFQKMGQIVEELQNLTRKLMTVMDKQTDAIISADHEQIETYTEEYTDLKREFNEREQNFVDQLHHMLDAAEMSAEEVRLERLKVLFPNAVSVIDEWKQLLRSQAQELKEKHERVAELLDFALNRNANLMHSIYSLNNRKNTHYSSGGRKEDISSGMAVNKKA